MIKTIKKSVKKDYDVVKKTFKKDYKTIKKIIKDKKKEIIYPKPKIFKKNKGKKQAKKQAKRQAHYQAGKKRNIKFKKDFPKLNNLRKNLFEGFNF